MLLADRGEFFFVVLVRLLQLLGHDREVFGGFFDLILELFRFVLAGVGVVDEQHRRRTPPERLAELGGEGRVPGDAAVGIGKRAVRVPLLRVSPQDDRDFPLEVEVLGKVAVVLGFDGVAQKHKVAIELSRPAERAGGNCLSYLSSIFSPSSEVKVSEFSLPSSVPVTNGNG